MTFLYETHSNITGKSLRNHRQDRVVYQIKHYTHYYQMPVKLHLQQH